MSSNFAEGVLPRNWRVMCHDSAEAQRHPSGLDMAAVKTAASSARTLKLSGIPTKSRIRGESTAGLRHKVRLLVTLRPCPSSVSAQHLQPPLVGVKIGA